MIAPLAIERSGLQTGGSDVSGNPEAGRRACQIRAAPWETTGLRIADYCLIEVSDLDGNEVDISPMAIAASPKWQGRLGLLLV